MNAPTIVLADQGTRDAHNFRVGEDTIPTNCPGGPACLGAHRPHAAGAPNLKETAR